MQNLANHDKLHAICSAHKVHEKILTKLQLLCTHISPLKTLQGQI